MDGNGGASDYSTIGVQSVTYSVQSNGAFTMTFNVSGGSNTLTGQLSSTTEGTLSGFFTGKLIKVSDTSASSGSYTGVFTDTATSNVYNVSFSVDTTGAITSLTGFTAPVSGKMFQTGSTFAMKLLTGTTNYNQIRSGGTFSSSTYSGDYGTDNGKEGVITFTKATTPTSVSASDLIGTWLFDGTQSSWSTGGSPAGWSGPFTFNADNTFHRVLLETTRVVHEVATGSYAVSNGVITAQGQTETGILSLSTDKNTLTITWSGGDKEVFTKQSLTVNDLAGTWALVDSITKWNSGTSPIGWTASFTFGLDSSYDYKLYNSTGALDEQGSGNFSISQGRVTFTPTSGSAIVVTLAVSADAQYLALCDSAGGEVDQYKK